MHSEEIEFDDQKREETLLKRKIDMADAALVVAGATLTYVDDRYDYGEERFLTFGLLRGRMVLICWAERGNARRIISMRKTNERETKAHRRSLGIGT